jgi:hypothetical protein
MALVEQVGSAAGRLHTIQRLYAAFERRDGEAMQALYAPQATFEDPVFELHGAREIGGMWRMLCRSAKKRSRNEWSLAARGIEVEGRRGRAQWEVTYLYGAGDRLVHNIVAAEFEFADDGLILRHVDRFDFRAWARQALGLPGKWFGGTAWMQRYVRRQAAHKLERYLSSHL